MAGKESKAEELREALRLVRSERRATLDLVAGLDEARARRAPADGGWSVAQVMDHLIKTDGVYRLEIGRLLDLRAAGRPPVIEVGLRELNTRPFFVPAALLPHMDVPFRLANRLIPSALRESLAGTAVIPFQAPDEAAPAVDRPLGDLRLDAAASTQQIETMLAGQDVSDMILDHPMLGRHTVPSLLRILARHENRHQAQISRIIASDPTTGAVPVAGLTRGARPASESTTSASDLTSGFAHDAEEALKAGRQIVSWWRDKTLREELKLFPLKPAHRPYFGMQGFFDSIHFIGQMKPTSIMGCLQTHRFARRRPPTEGATAHLESFIDEHFLVRSYQVRPDGSPGGFRYRPICYKEKDGRLVEPVDRESLGMNLTDLRKGREWGVLRVDILDFLRVNPSLAPYDKTLSRFIRQSAYVVVHEDMAIETARAPKDVIAERRFGYAFLPRSVEPNFFGFGPGKFGAAIKQWRFLLYMNGDVEVQVSFLVAPRSERVMDFGGFDPVYAGIKMANVLSLGAFGLNESGHAALDHVFLEHHGTVHAAIVQGMAEVWEGQRWMPSFGAW